ncbi:MAG: hypothetical protein RLZZ284_1223 [Actinomycetota bacterium]
MDDFVSDLIEERPGVDVEPALGAVPSGVAKSLTHQANRSIGVTMRVSRTIIFVDLSGFSEYLRNTDDTEAKRVLTHFRRVSRDLASEVGVRIDKFLGDGFMAVSVEQDAGIVFAMELHRRLKEPGKGLRLRIGIASGEMMLIDGDDYIGEPPNLASRLCDEAHEFGTLIPTDQTRNLPAGVRATPVRDFDLRGFAKLVPVSRLSGEPLNVRRNDTEELWTRTPYAV